MKIENNTFRLVEKGTFGSKSLIIGLLSLAVSIPMYFLDSGKFFFSYLTAFMFLVTLTWGALFSVLLGHLTNAKWNLIFRRISEVLALMFPVLAIMFIPIIFGAHDLYHWSHANVVVHDAILQKKSGYLNITFFSIRAMVYFAIWYFLSLKLYKLSLEQDKNPSVDVIMRMRKVSAPGMILFALSITFASFDWLMSLEPHWYSTIYGLYVFSGGVVFIYSFLVIFGQVLRKKDVLHDVITVEHYHDLGKLLFGFIIFWGYMGFSQYFLMWYANIPEETYWYYERWQGSWKIITMIIVFGHFVFPFVGLLTRSSKRSFKWMLFMAIWISVMHYIDLYWLAVPTFKDDGVSICYVYFTNLIGLSGLYLWYFWNKLAKEPLLPIGDYRLKDSIDFENV